MESITVLTTTIISILSFYLGEIGKSVIDKSADAIWTKCEYIYSSLVSKFKGNENATKALTEFAHHSTNSDAKSALEEEVKHLLAVDKVFLDEIIKYISETQLGGTFVSGSGSVANNGGVSAGSHGVAIQGNVGGDISIK